jgi:hypothetical protein
MGTAGKTVKDTTVNSHNHSTSDSYSAKSAIIPASISLIDSRQHLEKLAVIQGSFPQQGHIRILSPYQTYS